MDSEKETKSGKPIDESVLRRCRPGNHQAKDMDRRTKGYGVGRFEEEVKPLVKGEYYFYLLVFRANERLDADTLFPSSFVSSAWFSELEESFRVSFERKTPGGIPCLSRSEEEVSSQSLFVLLDLPFDRADFAFYLLLYRPLRTLSTSFTAYPEKARVCRSWSAERNSRVSDVGFVL